MIGVRMIVQVQKPSNPSSGSLVDEHLRDLTGI